MLLGLTNRPLARTGGQVRSRGNEKNLRELGVFPGRVSHGLRLDLSTVGLVQRPKFDISRQLMYL